MMTCTNVADRLVRSVTEERLCTLGAFVSECYQGSQGDTDADKLRSAVNGMVAVALELADRAVKQEVKAISREMDKESLQAEVARLKKQVRELEACLDLDAQEELLVTI